MAQKKDDELRRVHDLVLTSLNTAHWIVAAVTKIDSRRKPPDAFIVGGLVEAVLSDPGESPAVTEQFIGVADTSEDIGLPYGFPATSWHCAAGQIVARVFSAIVNPKGYVSGIAGVKRSAKQVELDEANLKKWWPKIRMQLKPLTTVRFDRLHDLLKQEYCHAAQEAAKQRSVRQPRSKIQRSTRKEEQAVQKAEAVREEICKLVETALIGRPFLLARFKFLARRKHATNFATIGQQENCWRIQGTDVARGLKDLQTALNELAGAPSLKISPKNKTAVLDWPV